MAFIITTTVSLPGGVLVIPEFGNRTYTHPLTSYDLGSEFDIDEIRVSTTIQTAITNGWITVVDENSNVILNVDELQSKFIAQTGTFGITIENSNAAITPGLKQYLVMPYACTITGFNIIGDTVGNCVLDVWKNTTVPTVVDTITGTEKPTLLAQQINSLNTLNTWSVNVSAGDIIAFSVESASILKKISLIVSVVKI